MEHEAPLGYKAHQVNQDLQVRKDQTDQKVLKGLKEILDFKEGKDQRVSEVCLAERVRKVFLVMQEGMVLMARQVTRETQDLMALKEHQEFLDHLEKLEHRVHQDPRVSQAQQVHLELLVRKEQQVIQV